MLIQLSKIIILFDLQIKGVLHIGAHYGQEYSDYKENGIENMIFFEPVKSTYEKLVKNLPDNIVKYNIALGNEVGIKEMFIETANEGQSCSLLEPKYHLEQYPHIRFNDNEIVKMDKLDNILFIRNDFNMINIDVQGYELEVFKGAVETLNTIDYIYTEVNFVEMYKNCCIVNKLDIFLREHGFKRVLTNSDPKTWGDALYLKQ
ncbi:MAG: FkbM family methyltransferase [Clostridia bacterium]|jgi:FkbM family methyltransferase